MILLSKEEIANKKIKKLIAYDFGDLYDESSLKATDYEISFNLKFDLDDDDNLVYLHEIVTVIENGLNICVDSITRLSIDYANRTEVISVLFSNNK